MTHRLPYVLLVLALLAGCGKNSNPAAPTQTPTPTRIIGISGGLDFGDVGVGSTFDRSFTILNTGTEALTVSGMSGPTAANFAASWVSGAISPGGSQPVTVRFIPTEAKSYSGTLTISANQTAGNNTIPITAVGIRTAPTWTRNGTGNTVFDMPAYVARVRIQGEWSRRDTSNFIVHLAGRGLVNEILRDSITYSGEHLTTGGGVVEIVSSNQITWSFTEIR